MRLRNLAAASGTGRGLTAMILMVLAWTGCKGERVNTVSMDIPFRADGILEFVDQDSTVITRIAIEIAATDSAQIRGLMDRRSLPERGGMLFYYEGTDQRSFWMRSTPLPLDILFIREDGTVANVARHTTPYSDSQIRSDGPVQNVLEVRAGFTERWNIDAGTRIRWRRVDSTDPT